MAGVFLFNIFCGIVSCDPMFRPPTPIPSNNSFMKEVRERRNWELAESVLNPAHVERPPPLVETKSGFVEGYFMKVISGREIYAFEGIPYAEAPSGNRRFRAPVPKKRWKGIRQVTNPGPYCLQIHPARLFRVIGDEDCLFVNVYSPKLPSQGHHPNMSVLIWIHGGGSFFGGGFEYGPSYLLQKDIILVTINFRVGALGLLSTGDEESPGNWGLKDQALAVKWVADNIGAFGGNNRNITLSGQSAGASAVHLHMMSNMTKHLFQRAISISGSALVDWAVHTPHQALKWTEKLAAFVNCPINRGTKPLMDCFRGLDPNLLTGSQYNLFDVVPFPLILLRPVIEPNLPGAFLIISPQEAYEQNQVAKIPFMVTNTNLETEFITIILQGIGVLPLWQKNWEVLAPTMYDYGRVTGDNATAVTRAIADFYLPGKNMTKISRQDFSQIGSDRLWNRGTRRTLKYHSSLAPTYSYIFSYRNPYGYANLFGLDPNNYGVGHSDDLTFIFNSTTFWDAWNGTENGYPVSELTVSLITNFVMKGEPLATDPNGVDYHIWDPVTNPQNLMFLEIGKEIIEMVPDRRKREMEFWDRLGINSSYAYPYA